MNRILIEKSPCIYEKCFLLRSTEKIIENYALVSLVIQEKFVQLIFGNSWPKQVKDKKNSLEHAKKDVIAKY